MDLCAGYLLGRKSQVLNQTYFITGRGISETSHFSVDKQMQR
jgi:hypothetical protein